MDCIVISYMCGVDGLACSHHIDDRIPYFKEYGVDVRMVTSYFAKKSSNYTHSRGFFVHPEEVRNYLRYKLKKRIRNKSLYGICMNLVFLPLLPFRILLRIILPRHDVSIWWAFSAYLAIIKQCRTKIPDVLYSTGGSHSAHLAAAWAAKRLRIPWVAEFQDPPVHSYYSKSRLEGKFIRWMEKKISAEADAVVYLTDNARKSSEIRTGKSSKGITIYPGSNPLPTQYTGSERKNREVLKISHIGSLGGNRNMRNFLTALENSIEEKPQIASEMQIEIIGSVGDELIEQLEISRHKIHINLKGKLPRRFVYRYFSETDLLLLIQGLDDVSFGQIPLKTYEYLSARKPILGLLYGNDELSVMLTSRGHYTAKGDDVDDIRVAILEIYSKWKGGTLNNGIHPTSITVQKAVDQLVSLFRQINEKSSVSV